MENTSQTQDNLATIDMMLQPINDRIDTVNGELIDGGVPGKMDKLDTTKEAIRQVINQKGVEVRTDEPFSVYPDKIGQLPELPVDDWQPNPTWWDIEKILEEDTRDYAFKAIFLYMDNEASIYLQGAEAYATSDGAFYTEDSDHVWDTFKDRQCVENGRETYKTRYVIVYSQRVCTRLPITNVNPNNTMLGAVVQGQSAEALPNYFEGLYSVQFIIMKEGISTLKRSCFANCNGLQYVGIPRTLTQLPETAFSNCIALKTVVLPDTLTSISLKAFMDCRALSHIHIPASVTIIEGSAFIGCYSLKYVTFAKESKLASIGTQAFTGTALCEIVIPNSVTTFGTSVFANCYELRSVKLPLQMTEIPQSMFADCQALQKIDLPQSLQIIGLTAFKDSGLIEAVLPASLQYIGNQALSNSALCSLIFEGTMDNASAVGPNSLSYVSFPENFDMSLTLSDTNLSPELLTTLFGRLKDRTGLSARAFKLSAQQLSVLTDEQKAIATTKNWVLA